MATTTQQRASDHRRHAKSTRRTSRTAQHRPAARRRTYRHDDLVAVDLFSGFGGLTQGIERAGFTTIMAANHNEYKVEVHEANHPHAEHWIADLVDPDAGDYHSARDLPPADLLVGGSSCVNNSQANTKKAYAQGLNLFTLEDPDFEERVTRSERDRATALCFLQYAQIHHPLMILVECTTQLASWGNALPNKPKIGDGSTYRWWLKQFELLGYNYRVLYLNSMFFGVPQSRDRGYWVFWDKSLPTPDLDHRPPTYCGHCDTIVEAKWTWKTRVPPTGKVCYGEQYIYTCPSCRNQIVPPHTPSVVALDLSYLGPKIKDRDKPLADSTMARAERCRQRFAEFPAVLMPAKALRGSERHPWQPMSTQTSQQETGLLSAGMVMPAHRHNGDGQPISRPMDTVTTTHEKALLSTAALLKGAGNTFEWPGSNCRSRGVDEPLWTQSATQETALLAAPTALAIDNYQGVGRGVDDPLPTQGGSETFGLLSAQVMCNRENHSGRSTSEAMHTVTAGAGSGGMSLLSTGVMPYRKNTVPTTHGEPMPTVTADQIPGLLTAAGRIQCNGSIDEAHYRAHPLDKPLGTVTSTSINQSLLFSGWFKQNGSTGSETAAHPLTDPFGTLTSRDTTALLTAYTNPAEWYAMLRELPLEEHHYRMLGSHEVGRGCGFDVDFPGHDGTFKVWGSDKARVDGYGNAVSPQVGWWIGGRLRVVLHGAFA